MTEPLTLALVGTVPATLAALGTWYATKVTGGQNFVKLLMEERKDLKAEIKACYDEIRLLRTEVAELQHKQRERAEKDDVLDELDRQIRHDGATLIRNCLTVIEDAGIQRPDLTERARTLEKIRDMRREAAGQALLPAIVPK